MWLKSACCHKWGMLHESWRIYLRRIGVFSKPNLHIFGILCMPPVLLGDLCHTVYQLWLLFHILKWYQRQPSLQRQRLTFTNAVKASAFRIGGIKSSLRAPQMFPMCGIGRQSNSSSITVFKSVHLVFLREMIAFHGLPLAAVAAIPSPRPVDSSDGLTNQIWAL